MNYFLGFFTDEKSNYKIRKVVGEVGRVFDDFGIPVRWVKPETYHITLFYLGENLNPIKRFLLSRRLKKFVFKPFSVKLNTVRLGISRNYKELVYLDLLEGGDTLRNLYLDIHKIVGTNDSSKFVPHLTIGRVSKDLTEEEQRNISKDLSNICESLNIEDISFNIYELCLVKSEDGNYSILIKLSASSNILL